MKDHSDKPMSGTGSLVNLDQQIITNAKYKRQTDPNGVGAELVSEEGAWVQAWALQSHLPSPHTQQWQTNI